MYHGRERTRQFEVLVFHFDKIAVLAELRLVKVTDRHPQLRQADEFFSVKTSGVSENT